MTHPDHDETAREAAALGTGVPDATAALTAPDAQPVPVEPPAEPAPAEAVAARSAEAVAPVEPEPVEADVEPEPVEADVAHEPTETSVDPEPAAPAEADVPPLDVDAGTGALDAAPVASVPLTTDTVTTDPEPVAEPVEAVPASAVQEQPPAEVAGSPARRSVLPTALVGLLALALLAGTVFLGLLLREAQQTQTAREEATAASRDAARVLFSYDHATLDEDFARGLAVTTGTFTDEYRRTTDEVVKPVAVQYKAVVVADVVESAVIEAEPDEVTTLVFLNQATTSTRVEGQKVDRSRVRMRLVERGGRWLVSEVTAL